jgi:hypothetical protein
MPSSKDEMCEEANVEARVRQENSDEHARVAHERARKARGLPRQLAVIVREHDGSVTPHTLYLRNDGEKRFDFVYATPRHHAVDGIDSIILLIPKDMASD